MQTKGILLAEPYEKIKIHKSSSFEYDFFVGTDLNYCSRRITAVSSW